MKAAPLLQIPQKIAEDKDDNSDDYFSGHFSHVEIKPRVIDEGKGIEGFKYFHPVFVIIFNFIFFKLFIKFVQFIQLQRRQPFTSKRIAVMLLCLVRL